MARFRLRFLLQEIDLSEGETLIGRSTGCQVTIEDPLVSRRHARLRIEDGVATIEDLGSRNGLQINGRAADGKVELRDRDRIRIGTQELVFCAPAESAAATGARPTGFLCHCSACGIPYPTELQACPSCGSMDKEAEDTMSGLEESGWSLELTLEVLRKARQLERWDDVARLLEQARAEIDNRLEHPERLRQLKWGELIVYAVEVATRTQVWEWVDWICLVLMEAGIERTGEIAATFEKLGLEEREHLSDAARRWIWGDMADV